MWISWIVLAAVLLQGAAAAPRAVITGQITTGDGTPAEAIRVVAVPAPAPDIRPGDGQNYYASQAPAAVTLSDVNGRYRLENVPAGRYYVVAGLIGHGTFHPSTADIDDAAVVTPTGGSTLDGIDVRMRTSPGALLRGRITPPPFPDTPERAVLSGVAVGDLVDVAVGEDGRFQFGRIPAGEYFVSFIPQPPGMIGVPVTVGAGDVPALDVTRPAVSVVRGQVVVSHGPMPHILLGFAADRDYVRAALAADGTFSARLHEAPYTVSVSGMPVGYSVTAVRVGSRNAAGGRIAVNEAAREGVVVEVAAPSAVPSLPAAPATDRR